MQTYGKPNPRVTVIRDLQAAIAALEKRPPALSVPDEGAAAAPAWRLGAPDVDAVLPGGGLPLPALHEVAAEAYNDGPAAAGFAAALAVRRGTAAPLLWCSAATATAAYGALHGPGLLNFGLPPDRLLLVAARKDIDVLWAMEEGVRSGVPSLVVGEVMTADLTATRRLALAAQAAGVPALLLRNPRGLCASAAYSRWRIAARPSADTAFAAHAPGRPRWQVRLERCRGGRPKTWTMEWEHETGRLVVAAPLADRPAAAGRPSRHAEIVGLRRAG